MLISRAAGVSAPRIHTDLCGFPALACAGSSVLCLVLVPLPKQLAPEEES